MGKIHTLSDIARIAMAERGFLSDFSPSVHQELDALVSPALPRPDGIKDMRDLLWVSIDNEDSRDLDQLTYAESHPNGKDRIFIAVADVDALVKKGSAIDSHASHNTTSVYTPTEIFPMLPLKLSTNLTSLNEKSDRAAIVVEMEVDAEGAFELAAIHPALVYNHAKLAYPGVGTCIEEGICLVHPIPSIPGLRKQLELQDAIARRIQQYRNKKGALEFADVELHPIIVEGVPVGLEEKSVNRAHKLIENFMIAANVGVTRYLIQKNIPTVRRIVRTPKRWDRIVALARDAGETLPPQPDAKALRAFLLKQQKAAPLQFMDLSLAIIKLIGRGEYVLGMPGKKKLEHFDLAEMEYAHTTAPNRRFPDVLMQRLVKSALYGDPLPYTPDQLHLLAARCTQKEDDAAKVERRLVKCAAAMILVKQIGREFKAMVTGASDKGTWVRLLAPPVEGKLVKGFKGVDVGDYLTVKLIRVNVLSGHIDFSKA